MSSIIKLLEDSQEYIILGKQVTDYLENMFGELRQGVGGCYFITMQNVLQKLRIYRTRIMFHLNLEVPDMAMNH